MAASAKSVDPRLTKDGILRTALRMVDADGIEALSMRKLAAELGVNPMSLYHHVTNKAAVLDGITRMVTEGARDIAIGPGTWQEQLTRLAYRFRELILAHPHLVRHSFSEDDFIQRGGPMWQSLCVVLRTAGLPEADVEQTGAVLAALVGGLLLTEVNGTIEDTGFALAIEILVDGVAARVGNPPVM